MVRVFEVTVQVKYVFYSTAYQVSCWYIAGHRCESLLLPDFFYFFV